MTPTSSGPNIAMTRDPFASDVHLFTHGPMTSTASLSWCRQAAVCALFLTLSLSALPVAGSSQEVAGSSQEVEGYVRVPTSHANVHMGPSSGQQVLWLAPEGTVLPVIGRQGEWLIVQLSPELRETGIVMRWYRNEDRGYMHESTVEFVEEPRE